MQKSDCTASSSLGVIEITNKLTYMYRWIRVLYSRRMALYDSFGRNRDRLVFAIPLNPEAEFLDGRNWDKKLESFPPCYLQSPLLHEFYSPPPPLSKSGLPLVCNVNIVYGNLMPENSQDYARRNLNEIELSWIWLQGLNKSKTHIPNSADRDTTTQNCLSEKRCRGRIDNEPFSTMPFRHAWKWYNWIGPGWEINCLSMFNNI